MNCYVFSTTYVFTQINCVAFLIYQSDRLSATVRSSLATNIFFAVAGLDLTVAKSRCQIQGLYPLHQPHQPSKKANQIKKKNNVRVRYDQQATGIENGICFEPSSHILTMNCMFHYMYPSDFTSTLKVLALSCTHAISCTHG